MVLPGYMLAGYHKCDGYSTEGAIKYFLLGSFSSAIFLFGLAFVWGLTGSTRIDDVARRADRGRGRRRRRSRPGLAMGFAFLTTGVAFKIAAVPFHYWTPDAYQGSPTPVTGYLSVGPKIGAFALILRLFAEALGAAQGRLAAGRDRPRGADDDRRQPRRADPGQRQADAGLQLDRPHRVHAASASRRSPAASSSGLEGLLFYGAAYSFMNLGAFAVIAALQKRAGVTSASRRSPGSAGASRCSAS